MTSSFFSFRSFISKSRKFKSSRKYAAGKPVEISVGEDQGMAVLKVRDHGIGIAKGDQTRIFRRFERAVSPEFYGGLGLGLYIACEIAQ